MFIPIDSYNIHYIEKGNADKVILLLHGFALSCEIWKKNIEELSKNYRVIAPDILGFGKSDIPKENLTIEFLPEFLYKFMEKLNINSAYFVGHSMGGLISLWIAQKYPHCVEKLILVGSAGFKVNIPFHFRLFSLPIFGETMVKPNKKGLKNSLKFNVYNPKVITEELVDNLYEASSRPLQGKYYLRTCRNAIAFYGFKFKIIRSIQRGIKNLKIPVLIIWGREDKTIDVTHAYYAQKKISNAQLQILEECRHLPQLEYPEKFNQLINQFLNNTKA